MGTPQNLVLRSEEFDNAVWIKTLETITPNATVAPDGTTTADMVTDSVDGSPQVHAALQNMTLATPGGQTYTFSIYLKDASGGANPWCFVTTTSGGSGIVVNTLDGTVGTISATLIDYSVEDVGNGWWRMTVVDRTPSSFFGFACGVYTAASGAIIQYTGTGTARFYMWGAQSTRGGGPQPYTKTTTLYCDDGRPCRPPLLDAQNLVTRSEAIQNVAWLKNTGVVATDATTDVTDPLGGNTASKVAYDGTGVVNTFSLAQTIPALSFYKGELGNVGVWLRTLSGSFGLQFSENWSGTLTPITITSTWTFFVVSKGALADGVTLQFAIYKAIGDNAAHTFYMWHPQTSRTADYLGPYKKTQGQMVGGGPGRRLRSSLPPQNMLTFTQAFDNAAWNLAGVTVNADQVANPVNGTVDADQIVETAAAGAVHTNIQNWTSDGQRTYTLSAYLKNNTRQWAGLRAGVGVGFEATFDLVNGVMSANSGNLVEAGIAALPNGWFRCHITFVIDSPGAAIVQVPFLSNTGGAYTLYNGDITKSVYVWGAQLTRGASPQPYAPALSSTPLNLGAATRQRAAHMQNLQLRSEEFDNGAVWTGNGLTVTANAVANPIDGAVTADALVDTVANSVHQIFVSGGSQSFPEGTSWCASVYIKLAKPGTAPVCLFAASGAAGGGGCYFNLVTQARQEVFFPETFSKCEDVGNGWFRLSIFGRSHSSVTTAISINFYADFVPNTYLGNGTAVAWAWGAQVTSTSQPVPYVKAAALPTGAVTVSSGIVAPARGQMVYEDNLILNSEAFDLSWTPQLVTLTPNVVPGPFGGSNAAEKWTDSTDASPQVHDIFQVMNPVEAISLRVMTFSVYVFPILGINNIMLMLCNAQTAFGYFDLVSGIYLGAGGSGPLVNASCERIGSSGWLRCSITFIGSGNDVSIFSANSTGSGYIYQASGQDRFYLWGAQINVGATPTPYVKTTAAYPGVHVDARGVRSAV